MTDAQLADAQLADAPVAPRARHFPSLPRAERRLATAILALALIGFGVALYLTAIHYAGIKPICAAHGGCEKVQSSVYSKLAGVPVALLGLIGYVGILVSLAIRGDAGRLMGAVIAISGFGFSAYLTYRELFT